MSMKGYLLCIRNIYKKNCHLHQCFIAIIFIIFCTVMFKAQPILYSALQHIIKSGNFLTIFVCVSSSKYIPYREFAEIHLRKPPNICSYEKVFN